MALSSAGAVIAAGAHGADQRQAHHARAVDLIFAGQIVFAEHGDAHLVARAEQVTGGEAWPLPDAA